MKKTFVFASVLVALTAALAPDAARAQATPSPSEVAPAGVLVFPKGQSCPYGTQRYTGNVAHSADVTWCENSLAPPPPPDPVKTLKPVPGTAPPKTVAPAATTTKAVTVIPPPSPTATAKVPPK